MPAARLPIFGLWIGTYKFNGNTRDSFYYQFEIRTDSTVYTSGSGGFATGPWKLTNGVNFSATLTTMDGKSPEDVQTVTAIHDRLFMNF